MTVAVDRRDALTLLAGGTAALAGPGFVFAAPITGAPAQPFYHAPEQAIAEQQVLAIAQHPDVLALLAGLRSDVLATSIGQTRDGAATLDRALSRWAQALIMAELGKHYFSPSFLCSGDGTAPHAFNAATPGDNPDTLYRTAYIDGSRSYLIEGQLDPEQPAASWVMELGLFDSRDSSAIVPDITLDVLRGDQLNIAADGSFKITLGLEQQRGNHLSLRPGKVSVKVRDLLSDKAQRPSTLQIRERGRGTAKAPAMPSAGAVRDMVLQKLPGYVQFWSHYPALWMGGLQPNQHSHPMARHGAWGHVAGLRYALRPDQAMLVTLTKGAAQYTGIQLTDPWLMHADLGVNHTCLNSAQTLWNRDGSATYAICAQEPGGGNWLHPSGIASGFAIMRWQGVEPVMRNDGLIREMKVISVADLPAIKLI